MSKKEDPVKIHREGTSFADKGQYKEASEKFAQAADLYLNVSDFFDASYAMYKAAECDFMMKDYETAVERFLKSADIALEKSFDRFGVSALEYARDCYRALKKKKEEAEMDKKIKELKAKLAEAF